MKTINPVFIEFAYTLASKALEHDDPYIVSKIVYDAAYYLGIGLGGMGVYILPD